MSLQATFHVLGLAHQPVTDEVTSCAYTMKVVNMCRMLKAAGQKVILYHASSHVLPGIADEYVSCVPDYIMSSMYGYDFFRTYNQQWDGEDRAWAAFRRYAAKRVSQNLGEGDNVVLASFGDLHQGCCPPHDAAMTMEMGIGYRGIFARYRVFESYAWMHWLYSQFPQMLGTYHQDVVIPNYIDPSMFVCRELKEDFALYMGRVMPSKGVAMAYQACKIAGIPFKIVGKLDEAPGTLDWIKSELDGAEFLPMTGVAGRREILANAKVLLCPTQYIEPFGGIAVEAAYSGTPVISTDWGGFTETVVNGKTGFRVRDLPQCVTALRSIDKINPLVCHEWGKNFTIQAIWPRYAAYFEHQINQYNAGRENESKGAAVLPIS